MGYADGVFSICEADAQPNHAVFATGWGMHGVVPFIEASNSWSEAWGDGGRFLIHPECVTDVIIAGTMQATSIHPVGLVSAGVPGDATNPNWPWKQDDECPYHGGCVTDLANNSDYTRDKVCVSNRLNGKKVKVV